MNACFTMKGGTAPDIKNNQIFHKLSYPIYQEEKKK